jgi:hypothetical protein
LESEFIIVGSYDARQVGKPRTRWEDVIRRDKLQILGREERGDEHKTRMEGFAEGGQSPEGAVAPQMK